MVLSRKQSQQVWSEWFQKELPDDVTFFFVTLTLKQGLKRDDGTWESLTREAADNELLFFQKLVNQRVYGAAHERFDKALRWVESAEGGERNGKRAHRHLIIEKPTRFTDDEFRSLLIEVWSRSRWSHKQVKIEPARNRDAVLNYITKTGGDAVCVSTLNIMKRHSQTV